ncbi:HDOD domain-containing protein [Thermomonas hydrothermalis]|uniref:HDOD domain-containing protein n=1 Tax=Thermomonas hydrothermalis TaxID=213588 RepID=A0A1M4SSS2_9GAMM|nr:HDOD domain-containing protein [Thermomonas hydrothermalis]SHE35192.1 HDOD domain-containing protein [Thermomonas hydrothermalis]
MTLTGVWVGLGVLLVVAIGVWLLRRQTHASPAAPARLHSSDADDALPAAPLPEDAPSSTDADAGDLPTGRALTRTLFALAVDLPASQNGDEAAFQAIAATCGHLLARPQFQQRHLPRRPLLLPKLMRALSDPEIALDQIAQIVAEDPALSANVLRIANSPFYRVQQTPVESLPRAAALLGLDGLRAALSTALLQPVLPPASGPLGRLPGVVWEHTALTADVASGLMCEGPARADAPVAQMAALLHGLGAIALVQWLRENAHLVTDATTVARVLELYAAEVAHQIALAWELPPRIVAALDAQRSDAMPTDPLGLALRAGRLTAALTLLCRQGQRDPEASLDVLRAWAARHGVAADVDALWARLNP